MLVATISTIPVTMSALMDRLCSKYVNEAITDMKQILMKKLQNEKYWIKSVDYRIDNTFKGEI